MSKQRTTFTIPFNIYRRLKVTAAIENLVMVDYLNKIFDNFMTNPFDINIEPDKSFTDIPDKEDKTISIPMSKTTHKWFKLTCIGNDINLKSLYVYLIEKSIISEEVLSEIENIVYGCKK